MKKYINRWQWIGALLGAVGGFVYWREVGCLTGHCLIQSHWQSMAIWGATTGFLLTDLFYFLGQKLVSNYRDPAKRNV